MILLLGGAWIVWNARAISVAVEPDPSSLTLEGGPFLVELGGRFYAHPGTYRMIATFTSDNPPTTKDADAYRVPVNAGDVLTIQTGTPGDGAAEPVNLFDPRLELLDPRGAQATADDDSRDGRNAELTHTAAETGVYTVLVTANEVNSLNNHINCFKGFDSANKQQQITVDSKSPLCLHWRNRLVSTVAQLPLPSGSCLTHLQAPLMNLFILHAAIIE